MTRLNINLLITVVGSVIALIWLGLSISTRQKVVLYVLIPFIGIWFFLNLPGLRTRALSPITLAAFVAELAILVPMVKIITEYQRAVLFRFGKLAGELAPGLNVILPFGIDKVNLIDMRTFTIDVPRQEVITRDNVPVNIDAVVYFRIFSAAASVTQVQNYREATSLLAQTILRSVLGQHELDDMLAKRAELNETLRELLDEATDPWGVKVTAVEMKSLELPEEMKRAMAKQAEAERERRAKIIAAEGEWQAAKRLAEAAEELGGDPAALQLRYLQTLSEVAVERNSTIIFPLPMEILRAFSGILPGAGKSTPQQP